jgi:hypothetical protein
MTNNKKRSHDVRLMQASNHFTSAPHVSLDINPAQLLIMSWALQSLQLRLRMSLALLSPAASRGFWRNTPRIAGLRLPEHAGTIAIVHGVWVMTFETRLGMACGMGCKVWCKTEKILHWKLAFETRNNKKELKHRPHKLTWYNLL